MQGPPGSWCSSPSCWPTALNPGEAYQDNGGDLTGDASYHALQPGRQSWQTPSATARQQFLQQQAVAMRAKVAAAQARLGNAVMGIIKIAADELGITAGIDCVTKGDLGACGETALNVLMSAVGGVVGKILSKYGAPWKWAKAARLGKTLWKLAKDAGSAIMDFLKLGKEAKIAEDALAAENELAKVAKCNSFTPETQVKLANGTSKPIKNIKIGDKVLAADPKTGKTTAEPVVATIIGQGQKDLVRITIATEDRKTGVVIATANHAFWSASTHTWTEAAALQQGDRLQTPTGKTAKVLWTLRYTQTQRVNNLTIANLHTYYVEAGTVPVLVHNDFAVYPDGTTFEIPRGAQGPLPVNSGKGIQFTGGRGGYGLSDKVAGIRFMDPVTSGKHLYPNGYVSYANAGGQTVAPVTGKTVGKADPEWHIHAC
jgi:hypothetical protein